MKKSKNITPADKQHIKIDFKRTSKVPTDTGSPKLEKQKNIQKIDTEEKRIQDKKT